MVRDIEEIAKKTYQRGLGVGFIDSPEMRNRLRFEAERGWLRAYVLYLSDRPCAFWVGRLYRNAFHSEFMGYDPCYSRYSPGMFLIMRVLEDLCGGNGSEKIEEVDFGLGDAQYKEVLGNREWLDTSLYLFGPNLKGIGLSFLRTPIMAIDAIARAALEGTSFLPRIKRAWRNIVRPGERPQPLEEDNR